MANNLKIPEENEKLKNLFFIITAPTGRRGLLRVMADYEFKDRKIKVVKISILEGVLEVRKHELPSE